MTFFAIDALLSATIDPGIAVLTHDFIGVTQDVETAHLLSVAFKQSGVRGIQHPLKLLD